MIIPNKSILLDISIFVWNPHKHYAINVFLAVSSLLHSIYLTRCEKTCIIHNCYFFVSLIEYLSC